MGKPKQQVHTMHTRARPTQDYEISPISSLKLHPRNPRRGRVEAIAESIEHNGFYGAVVAQRSTGHVLAGNHRLKAARKLGLDTLPVLWLDVDDARALKILLADNRTSDLGDYDSDALATMLSSLAAEGDLLGTGYDAGALDELLAELTPPDDRSQAEVIEDDPPDESLADQLAEKWGVRQGQLWRLGEHRVACGDSTDPAVAARVQLGMDPQLMITDPPYGVEYDANWRNEADRANGKPYGAVAIGLVSNDERPSWTEAYANFGGAVAYVWHADRHASTVEADMKSLGFEIRSQIIWAKSQLLISRGHYHWQHEPCWYAVRKGKTATWQGDRKQTTLWQIDKPRKSETGHSTQKPLECMARPMRNHTVEGDAVYDPFLGSGTTLIAAEQLGRRCCGVEINPGYVGIIIQRWVDLTGGTPELDP